MIISRAPCRITLGGGGTDLPSFYQKHEGLLVAGAINKYAFVTVNRQFYDTYRIKGYVTEEHKNVEGIKHNLFREALKLYNVKPGIELTSMSDIPSGTGLGSSGSFLTALIGALNEYKYYETSKRAIAEDGCKIEIDILEEHEGKQDKYASSFGGIKVYKFYKNGFVDVRPVVNEDIIQRHLQQHLHFFYTGTKRKTTASDVLKKQDTALKKSQKSMTEKMLKIKEIGIQSLNALEDTNFETFGQLLNEHWKVKKAYNPTATSPFIDDCYKTALEHGALGGKIMGAGGGGGFFMFYHPDTTKEVWKFQRAMKEKGLKPVDFSFDTKGLSIIHK